MIPFREITLSDKETISSFTLNSPHRNCDLSFSNLCSWRFLYETQYAIFGHFLVFKFWIGEQLAYMMPIEKNIHQETFSEMISLKDVIKAIIDDARSEEKTFYLLGLCDSMRIKLETIFPDTFNFTEERKYADYLYLHNDLATLKGKKFQPKRNHVNKFRNNYPDYEYVPIQTHHIQECLDLEAAWCKLNNCDQQEGTGNERRALVYALHHFDTLGLTGGMLRVNKQIVAFTFGMPINHDTFGIHVEKANTQIEGAYAMINYEFANHIPEQYVYINREEDLGIEGLRKAKLSYHPVILLEKYTACLKGQPIDTIQW